MHKVGALPLHPHQAAGAWLARPDQNSNAVVEIGACPLVADTEEEGCAGPPPENGEEARHSADPQRRLTVDWARRRAAELRDEAAELEKIATELEIAARGDDDSGVGTSRAGDDGGYDADEVVTSVEWAIAGKDAGEKDGASKRPRVTPLQHACGLGGVERLSGRLLTAATPLKEFLPANYMPVAAQSADASTTESNEQMWRTVSGARKLPEGEDAALLTGRLLSAHDKIVPRDRIAGDGALVYILRWQMEDKQTHYGMGQGGTKTMARAAAVYDILHRTGKAHECRLI